MLLLFCLSSLLALGSTVDPAAGTCDLPLTTGSLPGTSVSIIKTTLPDGKVVWACPAASTGTAVWFYGKWGSSGPQLATTKTPLTCDPADGKFVDDAGQETMLTTLACVQIPQATAFTMCALEITPGSVQYLAQPGTAISVCPSDYKTEYIPGAEFQSLVCRTAGDSDWDITIAPGNVMQFGSIPLKCTKNPITTTTTVGPDVPVAASNLWGVYYYYNYGVGVHAFCADQTCINAIQKNGIGYDLVNGKGLVGRAVAESKIAAVRASCPTGSQYLRNLGFTKSGNKYLHNFSGTGLKQGWVSVMYNACGSKVAIKRWRSRYTDDMMYDTNLEWNTWYQGMVQDGGKVQFYMW